MSLREGELLITSKFLLARNLPTHCLKGFVGTSKTPRGKCANKLAKVINHSTINQVNFLFNNIILGGELSVHFLIIIHV